MATNVTRSRAAAKRAVCVLLAALLMFGIYPALSDGDVRAVDKTLDSEPLETLFFYAKNAEGADVLLAAIPAAELDTLTHGDTRPGREGKNYYFNASDNLPDIVYAEAQGFEIWELIDFVKEYAGEHNPEITTTGGIAFSPGGTLHLMATDTPTAFVRAWTYEDLLGEPGYYAPETLKPPIFKPPAAAYAAGGWHEGWETPGYSVWPPLSFEIYNDSYGIDDPYYADKRYAEVNSTEMPVLLATRYMNGRRSDEPLNSWLAANGDDPTGAFASTLSGAEALALCVPQTKAVLFWGTRTMYHNFKWIYGMRLDMANAPDFPCFGTVESPVASFVYNGDGSADVTLENVTTGASIYYSLEDDDTAQTPYTGTIHFVPEEADRDWEAKPLTVYAHAAQPGFADRGTVTLHALPEAPDFGAPKLIPINEPVHLTPAMALSDTESAKFFEEWTSAITQTKLYFGQVLPANRRDIQERQDYWIDAFDRSIYLAGTLFDAAGTYTLDISAAGYMDARVILYAGDPETPPPGAEDPDDAADNNDNSNNNGNNNSNNSTGTTGTSGGNIAVPQATPTRVRAEFDENGMAAVDTSKLSSATSLQVRKTEDPENLNLTLEFDNAAVRVLYKAGKTVRLKTSVGDASVLNEAQQAALAKKLKDMGALGTSVTLDAYIGAVEAGVTIETLKGGIMTVILDYAPAEGEDPSLVVAAHLTEDGEVEFLQTEYDAKTGRLSFTTSDFSTFVLTGRDNLSALFTDVAEDAWYYEPVKFLTDRNLVNGKETGVFEPLSNITRAELARILYNMTDEALRDNLGDAFADVQEGQWYYYAVLWAAGAGVAEGADGLFRPNDLLTRQEAAAMLTRYISRVAQAELPAGGAAVRFSDAAEIAPWAQDAVWAMQQSEILNGIENNDGTFRFAPSDNATRAEAAKMIAGMLERIMRT
ncbi:MAG: S-layer homology domain-containing protein [Clostridiales Family XIII bacterium]|jgi:hypothetical protein|nr:S-layer homology domain-containing protein [Clostridiales Family XIII bacterium]